MMTATCPPRQLYPRVAMIQSRPPQHNDLLPKHEYFCFQRHSRPKQIDDETKYQSDEIQHQAQRRPILLIDALATYTKTAV
jgi:hypothetical protein